VDGDRANTAAARPKQVPLRRNRDFNLLWTGQATSALGSQMSAVAYPLLVLAVTRSAAQAGIVASAILTGSLLLLLPAGVVADHYPRKRIMVITSLAQMTGTGTVAAAVCLHHVYLVQLIVVGFLQGVSSAFYAGASRGATRRIVTAEQMPDAMARTQARDRAATMIGPPAGGALFGVAQFLPFACDSVSFGAITLAAALLRTPLDPVRKGPRASEPLRRSVTRGIRFVASQPFLRLFGIWAAVINGIVVGVRLTVIVLARNHGATPVEVGALFSISAGCGLAGAIVAVPLTRLASGRTLALIASWLFPACAIGMAFAPWVWLIAAMAGVTGFAIMPANVLLTARATLITPDDLQAQTGNAMQLCFTGLSSFTPALFGALTDKFGAHAVILMAAVLYAATAVWLQLSRPLQQLNEPPAVPAGGQRTVVPGGRTTAAGKEPAS
jgi:MFS family permease